MTIEEAVSFVSNEDTRVSKPGLERIYDCMCLLGSPERTLNLIHIVGTNGKGSVTTMLASALHECGLKVGAMTSPYLGSLLDLYRINGQLPEESAYISAVQSVQAALTGADCKPTEFELSVAVGIVLFANAGCDIVLLEAGMGGSKDATHLACASLMTVLTKIDLDHTGFLGEDVFTIANEKLGITSPGEPVVLGKNTYEVVAHVNAWCEKHGNPCFHAGALRSTTVFHALYENARLRAAYQRDNIATVLTALQVLKEHTTFEKRDYIADEAAVRGIQKAYLPFRFDIRYQNPNFILDGGHNPDCIRALCDSLVAFSQEKCYHIVTGVMADKDYSSMYRMLAPFAKSFYTVTPQNARALPAEALAEHLKQYGVSVTAGTLPGAAEHIISLQDAGEDVLVTGTLYMMYDLEQLLQENEQ